MEAIKSQAIYQALQAFQESAPDIKNNIYDKMESKAKEAHRQVPNPAYAQATMQKAMNGMLEANYEKSIRNYYAKSINMAKFLDEMIDQRDHYYKEGQRQNQLVKDLLAQNEQLRMQKEELERQLNVAKEARLNHKELYDVAAEEALKAFKAQQALEQIIEHMEAEKIPQTL